MTASDGSRVPADQQIDGGPSVLYDAVVVLARRRAAAALARQPAAQDFVTDAFAHSKFIGYSREADALLRAAGLGDLKDGGFLELGKDGEPGSFIAACRWLRFWERQGVS